MVLVATSDDDDGITPLLLLLLFLLFGLRSGYPDADNVFAQHTLASGHATLRIFSTSAFFLVFLEHSMIPHLFLAKSIRYRLD